MQIHPELAAALAQLSGLPPIDYQTMPIAGIRQVLDHLPMPPSGLEMHEVRDLNMDSPESPLAARLYRPTADDNMPMVVFFHGGGWCIGTIDTHDGLCRHIALLTGMNVCSIDYRLAPEHAFPAPLNDAYAATRWVAAHAHELHSDPSRILVAGDSAGGNLAIATCLKARHDQWNGICGQLLLYPVCDARADSASYSLYGDMPLLSSANMQQMWAYYHPAQPVSPLASILENESLAGLPPAVVVTAELDILRDEGNELARRLAVDGVEVMHLQAQGMVHGFASFSTALPHVASILRDACTRLQLLVGAQTSTA